jgi:hypothetical protein
VLWSLHSPGRTCCIAPAGHLSARSAPARLWNRRRSWASRPPRSMKKRRGEPRPWATLRPRSVRRPRRIIGNGGIEHGLVSHPTCISDQRRRVARRPFIGLSLCWYEPVARTRVAGLGSPPTVRRRARAARCTGNYRPGSRKRSIWWLSRPGRLAEPETSPASRRLSAPGHIGRRRGLCNTLRGTTSHPTGRREG